MTEDSELMPYYVYITTNPAKTVLYIGVTNDLANRLAQHYANRGEPGTFAGKYFCYNLLYFEQHQSSLNAIAREKELKGWTRAKKDALIDTLNPAREFLQP
ncbi:GIY-YIG nuclease family protein [Hymenobacter oligotrophus]|nr:GIY-YIG nuclease family protein [Hymenobacter oligotrophus]